MLKYNQTINKHYMIPMTQEYFSLTSELEGQPNEMEP